MIMKHNILKIFILLTTVMTSNCIKILGADGSFGDGLGLEYNILSDNTVEVGYINPIVSGIAMTIPETVTYNEREYTVVAIGSNACYCNDRLDGIRLPSSILTIGDYAFYGCNSLENVETLQNVESIGRGAFYGCNSLESIGTLQNVKSIGGEAFYGCNLLTK